MAGTYRITLKFASTSNLFNKCGTIKGIGPSSSIIHARTKYTPPKRPSVEQLLQKYDVYVPTASEVPALIEESHRIPFIDPLSEALGIPSIHLRPLQEYHFHRSLAASPSLRLCLVMRDKTTGELAAYRTQCIEYRHGADDPVREAADAGALQLPPVQRITKVLRQAGSFFDFLPESSKAVLHFSSVFVAPSHRQHFLGSFLFADQQLSELEEYGVHMLGVTCTSRYSLKVARRSGAKVFDTLRIVVDTENGQLHLPHGVTVAITDLRTATSFEEPLTLAPERQPPVHQAFETTLYVPA